VKILLKEIPQTQIQVKMSPKEKEFLKIGFFSPKKGEYVTKKKFIFCMCSKISHQKNKGYSEPFKKNPLGDYTNQGFFSQFFNINSVAKFSKN
jgi:hypothetical protein